MGNRNPWLEHVKKVSKQMKSKTGEEKISLKEILKEAKLTWPAKKENMNAKKEDMNAEKEDMNYVLEHLTELVVKETNAAGGYGMMIGPKVSKNEHKIFKEKIKKEKAF